MSFTPAPIRRRLRNARHWLRRDADFIQSEKTPYHTIAQDDLASLRYYPPLTVSHVTFGGRQIRTDAPRRVTPLVIVAPLAVNMGIYDLFPDRSFIRYLLAKGFPVYLVDWGSPSRKHDSLTLADYFNQRLSYFLQQVREHSGQEDISLHGWSFGGLFSYCYTAAANDQHIRNLVLVGAPCDYHANGVLGKQYQRLSRYLGWLRQHTGFRPHHTWPAIWRSPGLANALGFKFTDPIGSIQNYINLAKQLDDEEFVVKHATNAAFLDGMEAYPGACVQDMMQFLFADNAMARGRLPMTNTPADLKNITANILLITGKQDVIVTRDCSRALLRHINSNDVTELPIKGSHMGIVGGQSAASESWDTICQWLGERDSNTDAAPANADKAKLHQVSASSTSNA